MGWFLVCGLIGGLVDWWSRGGKVTLDGCIGGLEAVEVDWWRVLWGGAHCMDVEEVVIL